VKLVNTNLSTHFIWDLTRCRLVNTQPVCYGILLPVYWACKQDEYSFWTAGIRGHLFIANVGNCLRVDTAWYFFFKLFEFCLQHCCENFKSRKSKFSYSPFLYPCFYSDNVKSLIRQKSWPSLSLFACHFRRMFISGKILFVFKKC
jgi:hypothetical protein